MASPESSRLPDGLVFRRQSTKGLPQFYRKRCAPSREVWILQPANMENSDGWTIQSNPMRSVPLQLDCAHGGQEALHSIVPRLSRAYHSASWLVRSLPRSSPDKRRSLRNASPRLRHSIDNRWRRFRRLPPETPQLPTARSEHLASRILVRPGNRPDGTASLRKCGRLLL